MMKRLAALLLALSGCTTVASEVSSQEATLTVAGEYGGRGQLGDSCIIPWSRDPLAPNAPTNVPQCAPGLYCSGGGVCAPLLDPGSECRSYDTSCQSGLCWEGKCPERIAPTPCDEGLIGSGTACPPGYSCQPQGELGGAMCRMLCSNSEQCTSGERCDPRYHVCTPTVDPGKACDSWLSCEPGYFCSFIGGGNDVGVCVPAAQPGEKCQGSNQCGEGATCVRGICRTTGLPGGQCAPLRQCLVGDCVGRYCTSPDPIGPGGQCDTTQECAAGLRCVSHVCQTSTQESEGKSLEAATLAKSRE